MRHCHQTIGILMDEVDGMSCGDKGGLHELFHIVQEQQQHGALIHPVICIGNRPHDKKLADTVYQEFPMRQPSEQEIVKRLRYICDCERVRIDDIALLLVAMDGAQDVRRTIHFLQELVFFGNDSAREITIEDVETVKEVTTKTRVDRNLFHITADVFAREHTAAELYDLYATDKNLVPLMIHENAPTQMQQKDLPADQWMTVYTDLLQQQRLGRAGQQRLLGAGLRARRPVLRLDQRARGTAPVQVQCAQEDTVHQHADQVRDADQHDTRSSRACRRSSTFT